MKCYTEEVDAYVRDRARCIHSEKQGVISTLPRHFGGIALILSKSRTWQKCTHVCTHCHCGFMRDMSAFSQFWILLLHLLNVILLINTKIPKNQSKLKCTVRKEADPGPCE